MKIRRDFSYGVIPVRQTEVGLELLLIHQNSVVGDCYWGFPKGHIESGETPVQTACRELKEETGLSEVTLEDQKSYSIEYEYEADGVLVKKTVTYFLGWVTGGNERISRPEEIIELRWCSLSEAVELMTHNERTSQLLASLSDDLRHI